ncbi:hypothetical protein LP123_01385 [Moraxella bovis]|uniref:Uncharacterized protein n=2 Tax=Moraxella TaxID=475 RepID=A0AAQ2Q863_MORBO|nr:MULTISPECIES: hypothetical protein [Moraxella]AWY21333.1 hypothetical protein DQF64_13055 [Moraxella bovis]OOR88375.1 hypothetical protein B0182_10080 [Moraxella bovis]UYZ68735.1 hypothetical protein LP122_01045 [Moraxella bovis]UYZ71112.1 hypothetical protein LP089_01085 [Moraxella bovis]UYZ72971.1 hypothetical protein LP105_11545 [Moraxella bovis]
MRKIQKHQFEPVSLLTAEHGTIEVTAIPAIGQPDWLVPTALIISVDEYHERIWTYLWRGQEVSVYHLIPKDIEVDKLVILEGNSDVHRLALQTAGELTTRRVRISDVTDIILSDEEIANIQLSIPNLPNREQRQENYLYQAVMLDGEMYVVPDLDLIAHRLVDLDS